MGDRFSEDPFVLFQLRGRTRNKLLADLAEQRLEVLAKLAEAAAEKKEAASELTSSDDLPVPPHPAVVDTSLWWQYDSSLDADLVVITPAMEGDTGLDAAGDLPLAEEPRFPKARQSFLSHLKEQGQALSQQAMIQAMATGA